jgi:hypothetical protein
VPVIALPQAGQRMSPVSLGPVSWPTFRVLAVIGAGVVPRGQCRSPGPGSGSGLAGSSPGSAAVPCCQAVISTASAVTASRKKLELRLDEIRREASEGDGGAELAEVRRQLQEVRAEERRMSEASQRLQVRVSALHDAKAAVEAACVAADETARATLTEVTGS